MIHVKKKFIIMIGITFLIVLIFYIYFIQQNKPQNIIENKLGVKLPSTSKVINYTYDNFGGYFITKISIDEQNVDNLKEMLSNDLGGISDINYPKSINFKNTCSWWDLDKQDIIVSFHTFASGKRKLIGYSAKSHEIWAFISKDKEGQNYLYISY